MCSTPFRAIPITIAFVPKTSPSSPTRHAHQFFVLCALPKCLHHHSSPQSFTYSSLHAYAPIPIPHHPQQTQRNKSFALSTAKDSISNQSCRPELAAEAASWSPVKAQYWIRELYHEVIVQVGAEVKVWREMIVRNSKSSGNNDKVDLLLKQVEVGRVVW
jgi:hypothetical protein